MYESLFKLEQACTNSRTPCIGSLPIEQACSNSGTACIGSLQIEQACSIFLGPYVWACCKYYRPVRILGPYV